MIAERIIVEAAMALRKLPEGRKLAQLFKSADLKTREYLEAYFADALELARKQ